MATNIKKITELPDASTLAETDAFVGVVTNGETLQNEAKLVSFDKASELLSEAAVATITTRAEAAATRSETAATRAESATQHPPIITSANDHWWIWDTTTQAYVDSGIDAGISISIHGITMLETTESPRIENFGTQTDPSYHFYIPKGTSITGITKVGTVGLVDTYRIALSDNTTFDFTVTNAKSITSVVLQSTVGLTKTYRISFNDGTYFDYEVHDGKGITSVTLQSSVGRVDTYRILFNDGTYVDYTVTNGFSPQVTIVDLADSHRITITDIDHPAGQTVTVNDGKGNMNKGDYDPTLAVYNAGGIPEYVDETMEDKQDVLVSGENIKTINNQQIIGSGNITITAELQRGTVVTTEAGTSSITLPFTPSNPSKMAVYQDGVLLTPNTHYTATTTAITLVSYTVGAGVIFTFIDGVGDGSDQNAIHYATGTTQRMTIGVDANGLYYEV